MAITYTEKLNAVDNIKRISYFGMKTWITYLRKGKFNSSHLTEMMPGGERSFSYGEQIERHLDQKRFQKMFDCLLT